MNSSWPVQDQLANLLEDSCPCDASRTFAKRENEIARFGEIHIIQVSEQVSASDSKHVALPLECAHWNEDSFMYQMTGRKALLSESNLHSELSLACRAQAENAGPLLS